MKQCGRCGDTKTEDQFYSKKRTKVRKDGSVHSWVGLYSNCKTCVDFLNNQVRPKYANWYKQYRIENKEKANQKSKEFYISTKQAWWDLISTIKPIECACCGFNSHTAPLDFHHIENKEKLIHKLLKNTPTPEKWEEAKKELNKCVILCANCHRIEHAKYNFV